MACIRHAAEKPASSSMFSDMALTLLRGLRGVGLENQGCCLGERGDRSSMGGGGGRWSGEEEVYEGAGGKCSGGGGEGMKSGGGGRVKCSGGRYGSGGREGRREVSGLQWTCW